MKTIFLALAIACAGGYANAQTNCTVVPKKGATVQTSTCALVPKQVCRISPDRRSVTCYKTVDLETLAPYDDVRTYYGPTGPVPGEKARFETKTLIIKGQPVRQACSRNNDEKTTTCLIPGYKLYRDPRGYWGYRPDPEATGYSEALPAENNNATQTSVVYK